MVAIVVDEPNRLRIAEGVAPGEDGLIDVIPHRHRLAAEASLDAQGAAGIDAETFIDLDDAFHAGFADAIGLGGVRAIVEREKAQFDRIRFLGLPARHPDLF